MTSFFVGLMVLLGGLVLIGFCRRPAYRERYYRRAALIWMTMFSAVISASTIGETLTDPGGWHGIALVLGWGVPTATLTLLAWYRPAMAETVLVAGALVTVVLAVWFAAASRPWLAVEESVGPVRALVAMAVVIPLGLLGWHRPSRAGMLLLVVGLVPPGLSVLAVGATATLESSVIATVPALIAGVCYQLAAAMRPEPQAARLARQPMP